MRDRRQYIGASDAAAILGLSEHKTPTAIWLEKRATEPLPQIDNFDMARGRASEAVIVQLLNFLGEPVKSFDGREVEVPGLPIIVHPDAINQTDGRIHELKAPGFWSSAWGPDGTDQAPREYLVQLHVQVAALHAAGHSIPVVHEIDALCGQLRRYRVAVDLDLGRRFLDKLAAWWHRHVVGGVPPAPVDLTDVRGRVDRAARYRADDEMQRNLVRWRLLGKLRDWAEAERKVAASQLIRRMADEAGVDSPSIAGKIEGVDGRQIASLIEKRREGGIDWAKVPAELRAQLEQYRRGPTLWAELRALKYMSDLMVPDQLAGLLPDDLIAKAIGAEETDE